MVRQPGVLVALAVLASVGLLVIARMIRDRRQRPAEVPEASTSSGRSAGEMLGQVRRTVGQATGQVQDRAVRVASQGRDRLRRQADEIQEQAQPVQAQSALNEFLGMAQETPVTVLDLLAGLGVTLALAILRRVRTSSAGE